MSAPAVATILIGITAGLAADSGEVRDQNTPRSFPEIRSRPQWENRAREIREQILISCGLWPLPERAPVRARIFGRIERDGYTVEKVYFRTYPGFYLAGNLYRPRGRGHGPFPAVLNPHGHWPRGRLTDTADGSVPARCIQLARMGIVAFSYDMVGYNDTRFADSLSPQAGAKLPFYHVHRQFGTNHTDQLWSISLMGLQTWNSIRAVDFLESLPDVDRRRIGCTGASGGGTQTFILGAVDDRVAALAPVCMVSHSMQGGCSCENAPGLRVRFSNMEIAAAAAPRPQLLVGATGDWTRAIFEVEGPAIAKIYQLLGVPERLRYVRFDANHNYNRRSREAVYAWFARWLLDQPEAGALPEAPYQKEADADLRVFGDDAQPPDALPMAAFVESLKNAQRRRWQWLLPRSAAELERFRAVIGPAWRHTLQLECEPPDFEDLPQATGRRSRPLVLLGASSPDGVGLERLTRALEQRGLTVQLWSPPPQPRPTDPFRNFFTTYNCTPLQRHVGGLLAECLRARRARPDRPLVLCGIGHAGLWALLAATGADAVVADACRLDVSQDESLLATELFCPGIRNIGTFEGAPMLAAPRPLLIHNTGTGFATSAIRSTYRALRAEKRLRVESRPMDSDAIADWIARLDF